MERQRERVEDGWMDGQADDTFSNYTRRAMLLI